MRKHCHISVYFAVIISISLTASAQNITITGKITNSNTGETVPAVSVTVKGTGSGTFTDEKGNFRLITSQKLPFTIVLTSIGFDPQEKEVTSAGEPVTISLVPGSALGVEVVISASRVPERILESPVSIERLSLANLREAPSTNVYDILATLKGVDMVTSSLTFKTPTTRGFGGSGNTRVNQFVDGMDNQAPGLNFSVGSVVGLSDLDLESIELLPGAASALYGAGGLNGTILLNSKSPFKYKGLSVQIKQGIMHTDSRQRESAAPYYDWSFRWAESINDKFAFKINMTLLKGNDWENENYSNYDRINFRVKPGDRQTDPAYDGVNIYGDENAQNMLLVGGSIVGNVQPAITQYLNINPTATPAQIAAFLGTIPAAAPFAPVYLATATGKIPNQNFTRTGYKEEDLVDYNTLNYKFNGALHYKITPKLEAIVAAYWGTGTTVYTGADRYSLSNLKIGQYKVELRGSNFYLRGYTTQENAGDSYNSTALASIINETWKPSTTWFPQYMIAYSTAVNAGASPDAAHAVARGVADQGRYVPGTDQFNTAKETIRKRPIPMGGLFTDKTDLYHAEGLYDGSKWFNNALDLQFGANYRVYKLNSGGTIFADKNGRKINVDEYGLFLQAARRLFDDKLKITAAGRYDKNKNFEGRFTPRVTAVVTIAKDQNIRASYQNGFRNPSNQNQYIDLDIVTSRLIGALPEFKNTYNLINNKPYSVSSVSAARNAFYFGGASAPTALAMLKQYDLSRELEPESMSSYEVGYKGLFNKKILLDLFFYYSKYKNFIGQAFVVQSKPSSGPANPAALLNPTTSQVYSIAVNNGANIDAYGGGFSIDLLLSKGYVVNTNISYSKLQNQPPDFFTQFNTPEFRWNLGFSNPNVCKNVGFAFNYRFQSSFLYEGTFAVGEVPSFGTIDGQVSYKWPKDKIVARLGASNLLNKYYNNAFGNPAIGGLYYVSFAYNAF